LNRGIPKDGESGKELFHLMEKVRPRRLTSLGKRDTEPGRQKRQSRNDLFAGTVNGGRQAGSQE
jgi:hypothetical protein